MCLCDREQRKNEETTTKLPACRVLFARAFVVLLVLDISMFREIRASSNNNHAYFQQHENHKSVNDTENMRNSVENSMQFD